MYSKIDRYILIAILVVVIIILYYSYKNNKDTGEQSGLLVAMANKLNASAGIEQTYSNIKLDIEPKSGNTIKIVPREETPEDGPEIARIAEKIYWREKLTKEEDDFVAIFPIQIDEEVEFCNQLFQLVRKFMDGVTDFTDEEKQFYDTNSEIIELELNKRKVAQDPNQKLTNDIKGANPPLAAGERLKIILSFFDDGIPKTVTQIADMYAEKTGTKASKGNVSTIFGKLEGKQLLWQEIEHNSRWKVYYGLPEWFEGKKLKKEYKSKIS